MSIYCRTKLRSNHFELDQKFVFAFNVGRDVVRDERLHGEKLLHANKKIGERKMSALRIRIEQRPAAEILKIECAQLWVCEVRGERQRQFACQRQDQNRRLPPTRRAVSRCRSNHARCRRQCTIRKLYPEKNNVFQFLSAFVCRKPL